MSTKKDVVKPDFYDIFQFGPEFEMEIPYNGTSIRENRNVDLLTFISDSSIERKNTDSETCELIAERPIRTKTEEAKFLATMQVLLPNFKSASGEEVFAHFNVSAGTHFHWSFKDQPDSLLFVYDTIEFQKYFFMRYLETFKSEKFLSRIKYPYCLAPNLAGQEGKPASPNEVKKSLRDLSVVPFISEYQVAGRRRWLNTQSIQEKTGLEIRLFPFLQTHAGVKQTWDFMKDVILDFYLKPETQLKIQLLKAFDELQMAPGRSAEDRPKILSKIDYKKLSPGRQILYDALTTGYGIISGESRLIIGEWIKNNPKLVTKEIAF